MNIQRIAKHLLMPPWKVKRAFPLATLCAIERAIQVSEAQHNGQIRFAIEAALHPLALLRGQTARARAIEVFAQLHVWDTQENNGVLIYVLLADCDVEIVADRGIHARAGEQAWQAICQRMETAFQRGDYQAAVIAGIEAVGQQLQQHFPMRATDLNELANEVVVL